jgi:hypothetical protein
MLDATDAGDAYDVLQRISWLILEAIGCVREPTCNRNRTRPWKHGKPRGLLYHYTGGPSAIKSMRWANHPGWGNEVSSWHVTVLDRIPDNIVGKIWLKHASQELRRLFPVPVVIMADWARGTWHGNWSNDVTLGIENRNAGYSKAAEKSGKELVSTGKRQWEPFTREQMVANINIGRLANHLFGLDPMLILPHQCVWATKNDTGPCFPIHDVRKAIMADWDPVTHDLPWLGEHPMAPDANEDDDALWERFDLDADRGDPAFVEWVEPSIEVVEQALTPFEAAVALHALGFNAGPEVPGPDVLRRSVRFFQRSTQAWGKGNMLKPDGVFGPKTQAAIEKRIVQISC